MSELFNSPLVFTDLDGTLLDHDSYSFESALPAIELLKSNNIPIIINSSKTFVEIVDIRSELNIKDPFIVENGAAIFFELDYFDVIPEGVIKYQGFYVFELSKPISYWENVFSKIELEIDTSIERFSNMDVQRVCDLTGLNESDAIKAKNRLYSDPIYFEEQGSELDFLVSYMKNMGHKVLVGGRFVHITNGYDKGLAMSKVVEMFEKNKGESFSTIALGDSNNDIAMLEKSDISIIICNKNKKVLEINKERNTYCSSLYGPDGWNEMLSPIINNKFI